MLPVRWRTAPSAWPLRSASMVNAHTNWPPEFERHLRAGALEAEVLAELGRRAAKGHAAVGLDRDVAERVLVGGQGDIPGGIEGSGLRVLRHRPGRGVQPGRREAAFEPGRPTCRRRRARRHRSCRRRRAAASASRRWSGRTAAGRKSHGDAEHDQGECERPSDHPVSSSRASVRTSLPGRSDATFRGSPAHQWNHRNSLRTGGWLPRCLCRAVASGGPQGSSQVLGRDATPRRRSLRTSADRPPVSCPSSA